MTNFLWALLGFFIGGMIGIVTMTLLRIGRESDRDIDRLPSVWVGFVEGKHREPLLIRMVKGYGIDVYMLNKTGDYEHVSKLPHTFTSRTRLEDYIKRSGPFLTRNDKEELIKVFQNNQEDKP